jgi:hypothetical protein
MKQFKSENYRLSSILVNHMKVKSSVNSTEKNCFIASLCIYIYVIDLDLYQLIRSFFYTVNSLSNGKAILITDVHICARSSSEHIRPPIQHT